PIARSAAASNTPTLIRLPILMQRHARSARAGAVRRVGEDVGLAGTGLILHEQAIETVVAEGQHARRIEGRRTGRLHNVMDRRRVGEGIIIALRIIVGGSPVAVLIGRTGPYGMRKVKLQSSVGVELKPSNKILE